MSFLDRWSRRLVRRGLRAGLLEGSDAWLAVAALVWLARFLAKRQPPLVHVERLRLGESIEVRHVSAPGSSRRSGSSRRERRATSRGVAPDTSVCEADDAPC